MKTIKLAISCIQSDICTFLKKKKQLLKLILIFLPVDVIVFCRYFGIFKFVQYNCLGCIFFIYFSSHHRRRIRYFQQ